MAKNSDDGGVTVAILQVVLTIFGVGVAAGVIGTLLVLWGWQ